jgi:hypothetical protein
LGSGVGVDVGVGVGVGVGVFVGVAVGEAVAVPVGCVGEEVAVSFAKDWVIDDGESEVRCDSGNRNISDAEQAFRKNDKEIRHINRGMTTFSNCIEDQPSTRNETNPSVMAYMR